MPPSPLVNEPQSKLQPVAGSPRPTPISAASRRHNSSPLAGDTAPLSMPTDGEVKSSSQPVTEEGGTPAAPSRGLLCTTAWRRQTGSLAKRSTAFPHCRTAGERLSRCQPLPPIRPPLLQEPLGLIRGGCCPRGDPCLVTAGRGSRESPGRGVLLRMSQRV